MKNKQNPIQRGSNQVWMGKNSNNKGVLHILFDIKYQKHLLCHWLMGTKVVAIFIKHRRPLKIRLLKEMIFWRFWSLLTQPNYIFIETKEVAMFVKHKYPLKIRFIKKLIFLKVPDPLWPFPTIFPSKLKKLLCS